MEAIREGMASDEPKVKSLATKTAISALEFNLRLEEQRIKQEQLERGDPQEIIRIEGALEGRIAGILAQLGDQSGEGSGGHEGTDGTGGVPQRPRKPVEGHGDREGDHDADE